MPEIEKSPLTCITDKVSCDREVPQHESNKVSKAIIMVQDFTTPFNSCSFRGTQREYSSKPLNIVFLDVF